MGTTADKLNKLLNTKQAIKQSIIDKGVDVSDDVKFADYPGKIDSIMTGDSESVWNLFTDNGTRGQYLFYYCNDLTELDVSNLDTSNMTDMTSMFQNCESLTELNLSNFDTSNVKNMSYMFCYCFKLTELDLSSFDTSNVTNINHMFAYCRELTELDLSNFDTKNITMMSSIFNQCGELSQLNVNNWDTSKVDRMSQIFDNCKSLTSLNLSNWDISKITASYYGFTAKYCSSLVDFYPPQNINADFSVHESTALSHDSLMRIINNLMTTTSTKTLTLGATNLAKLSSDEIAIATNKGWTVK